MAIYRHVYLSFWKDEKQIAKTVPKRKDVGKMLVWQTKTDKMTREDNS